MNTNLQLNPFRPEVVPDNNSRSDFFSVGVLIDAVLTGIKTSPHIPHPTHTQVNLAQEFYRRKHLYYASYVSQYFLQLSFLPGMLHIMPHPLTYTDADGGLSFGTD